MEKKLSVFEIFAIVLGAIIGWGAFMLPGTKFLKTAGVINTGIGLILGAICIVIIERSYHVMMKDHCEEGGEFSYVYQHLGPNHGFVVGWFLSLAYLTMIPLNAVAFPLVINKLFKGVLDFGYLYTIAGDPIYIGEILISFMIIIFFMWINLKGIKETGRVQTYIVFALIACVLIVFFGMSFKIDQAVFRENYITHYTFSLEEILKVFAITPFLYVGFDAIPQLANNLHFEQKKASMLAIGSLLVGMMIYNLLNITTAMAYSPEQAAKVEWALGSAVMTHIGKGGFMLLIVALGAAVSSGINGFMICSTKLIGAMGGQGILPVAFSEKNKKGVLSYAIIFVSVLSLGAAWFGREVISWIVDMSSLGASIAYFYVCFVTTKIHHETNIKNIGRLGMLSSALFMVLLMAPFSSAKLGVQSLIALGIWCMIGFCFWRKIK